MFSFIVLDISRIIIGGTMRPRRSHLCANVPVKTKSSGTLVILFSSAIVNFLSSTGWQFPAVLEFPVV
jgi:hypothetical protein